MGSKKHLIYNMFRNPNRPFYKIGRHFQVGKIEKKQLKDFVIRQFEATEKKISEENAENIVELAECNPYYVQHLGNSVWRLTEEQVDEGKIERALSITLAEERSGYMNIWEELSLNHKKTLILLATTGKEAKIYSKKILQKHDLTSSAVQKACKSLLRRDIIDKKNGNYEICDVFFKKWLQLLGEQHE